MEHNLGKLLWNKSSSFSEISKRLFSHLWGAMFVCLFFALFFHVFIQQLLKDAPSRDLFYWIGLIGAAAICLICMFAIFIMIKNTLNNCKKQHLFIHERGLIYKVGKNALEILFRDIKGIQDMLQIADDGETTTAARIFTMVYYDDSRKLFDQHDVPSYDECFMQLRQAYNAFFLQEANDVGLQQKPIWLGEGMHFDGERLHVYADDGGFSIPIQDITDAGTYEGKANAFIKIHGKIFPSDIPELLAKISCAALYNPDLLYWRIAQNQQFL